MILLGDCIERMADMDEASVDAIVTDPPAGISFMGKAWDSDRSGGFVEWLASVMREALRVAKPGAHAVVWALPRTCHWTGSAIEGAGWEVRDVITHHFGSGFPKSHNLGNGYGTALKPATEFYFLARKPLIGTVAQNVQEHGTGAINVDGTRIGSDSTERKRTDDDFGLVNDDGWQPTPGVNGSPAGRWPPNVALSHLPECERVGTRRVKPGNGSGRASTNASGNMLPGRTSEGYESPGGGYVDPDGTEQVEAWRCAENCPVAELDRQSGIGQAGTAVRRNQQKGAGANGIYGSYQPVVGESVSYCDFGGASRFFLTTRGAADDGTEENYAPYDSRAAVDEGESGSPHTGRTGDGAQDFRGSREEVHAADCNLDDDCSCRFRYVAKASRAERNAGLDGFEERRRSTDYGAMPKRECNVCGTRAAAPGAGGRWPNCEHDDWRWVEQLEEGVKGGNAANFHPT